MRSSLLQEFQTVRILTADHPPCTQAAQTAGRILTGGSSLPPYFPTPSFLHLRPAVYILLPASCFLHLRPAVYILLPASCFLHPASCWDGIGQVGIGWDRMG